MSYVDGYVLAVPKKHLKAYRRMATLGRKTWMKHGAVDFLPKPFRDQDMLDAVTAAIKRDTQRRVTAGDVSRMRDRFGTLTARERQVMFLVTAGKMNKQVAGELAISEITVKIHRGAAMRKMGAKTLADLVRMATVLKPTP